MVSLTVRVVVFYFIGEDADRRSVERIVSLVKEQLKDTR